MAKKSFERPVAIVTGGSRGIGRDIVQTLARDGYIVAFCYASNHTAAQEVLADLPNEALGIASCVDVRSAERVSEFVSEVSEKFGRIDAAIHCAGITQDAPMVTMPTSAWEEVLATNLTGAFNLCQAAAWPMIRNRGGSIVLCGSVAGRDGNIGQANYSASKSGLTGLAKTAALELARWNIRVNVVAPGFVETDMTSELGKKALEGALEKIPLKSFATPSEVAELVSFLTSQKSRYITRQTIGIDGGLVL